MIGSFEVCIPPRRKKQEFSKKPVLMTDFFPRELRLFLGFSWATKLGVGSLEPTDLIVVAICLNRIPV